MKRCFSMLLCLILLISCVGCSASKSNLPPDYIKVIKEYVDGLTNSETARICGDILISTPSETNTSTVSVMIDVKDRQGQYLEPIEFLFMDTNGYIGDDDGKLAWKTRVGYQILQEYEAIKNETFEDTPLALEKEVILSIEDEIQKQFIEDTEFTIVDGKSAARQLHMDYINNNESLDYRYLKKYYNKAFS